MAGTLSSSAVAGRSRLRCGFLWAEAASETTKFVVIGGARSRSCTLCLVDPSLESSVYNSSFTLLWLLDFSTCISLIASACSLSNYSLRNSVKNYATLNARHQDLEKVGGRPSIFHTRLDSGGWRVVQQLSTCNYPYYCIVHLGKITYITSNLRKYTVTNVFYLYLGGRIRDKIQIQIFHK